MPGEVIDKTVDDPALEVTGEEAAAGDKDADKGAEKDAGKKDEHAGEIAALQKELKDNKTASDKRVTEAEEATKVWYDRAEKATAAEPKPEKAEEADPLDVFDDETKTAVRSYVKQATSDMVRSDEVDKRAQAIVRSTLTQDQLMRDYPELGDKSSEFFKNTTENYQQLDGVAGADRLRMAVEQTELIMRRAGSWKDRESESDRLARIAAQAGGGNGGSSDEGGSQELSKPQKDMAANMGVSEDAYRKAADKVAFQTHGQSA